MILTVCDAHRENLASLVFLSGPPYELLCSYNIWVIKPQISQATLQNTLP